MLKGIEQLIVDSVMLVVADELKDPLVDYEQVFGKDENKP